MAKRPHMEVAMPSDQDNDSTIRRAPTPQPAFNGFRRYGRADLDAEIIAQDSDGWEVPLECVNLSPTGMFVESKYFFDLGDEHTLIFRSPMRDRMFRVRARVVRVEEGEVDPRFEPEEDIRPGMAYEFVSPDEETWERLCEIVSA